MRIYIEFLMGLALTALMAAFIILLPFASLASDLPPQDFILQVVDTIRGFGGLGGAAKIAAIIMLLISTTKVSFLRPVWDKLGPAKALVWAALALAGGALLLPDDQRTFAGYTAWLFAGGGAVLMHQALDAVKAIPGVGAVVVTLVDVLMALFKAPPKSIQLAQEKHEKLHPRLYAVAA